MEKKPSLKIYLEETETRYVRKVAVIVNEDTHPELKGMDEEEMKKYVEENISKMKSMSEYFENLEDRVYYAEEEWDKYHNQSSNTVIEVATEEDINEYGQGIQHGHDDDDDEDDPIDDDYDDETDED